jgi:hypothetical protein
MKLTSNVVFAGVCASAVLSAFAVNADTVYEVKTSTSTSKVVNPNAGEFGQTVIFANQTEKLLTQFSLAYNANYTRNAGLVVRFYDVDNSGAPKNLLYQSSPQDIKAGYNDLIINFNSAAVPATFTYTVNFAGVDSANTAGLLAPNLTPNRGFGYNDIWVKDGSGNWSNQVIPGSTPGAPVYSFFSAKISAVPEPSTYALAGLAGIAWLGVAGYRRVRG